MNAKARARRRRRVERAFRKWVGGCLGDSRGAARAAIEYNKLRTSCVWTVDELMYERRRQFDIYVLGKPRWRKAGL